jgi:peptidoglycan/xylan/chitin deacetylase (PgdA/CDA1 family)
VRFQRFRGGAGTGRRRDAVIVYHAIGRVPRDAPEWNGFVSPERFAEQIAYLREHRRVVDLDALLARDGDTGRPRVAITFDDGYRSVLEEAVPMLEKNGLPATFFVPTKWIGAWNGWNPDRERLELMREDELVGLARRGFAVECHGHAHLDYGRVGEEEARADVQASVERLAALLGRPPRYLAYPYGTATPAAAARAEELGLRAAFTLDRPEAVAGDFALRRVSIVPADRRPLFALKSSGRYIGWRQSRPVRTVYRTVRPLLRNRWLWP